MEYAIVHGQRRCSCVRKRFFFFQAEDGIRDLVRSRGLGDVYRDRSSSLHLIDGKK